MNGMSEQPKLGVNAEQGTPNEKRAHKETAPLL